MSFKVKHPVTRQNTSPLLPSNAPNGGHKATLTHLRKPTLEELALKLEIEEIQILHQNAQQAKNKHQHFAGEIQSSDDISPTQREINEHYQQSKKGSPQKQQKMGEILNSYTTYDKKKRSQTHTRYIAAAIDLICSVALLNIAIYIIHTYSIPGFIEPFYYLLLLIFPHYLILQRVIKKYSQQS